MRVGGTEDPLPSHATCASHAAHAPSRGNHPSSRETPRQGWPPVPRCGPGGGQAAKPPMHPWRGLGRRTRCRLRRPAPSTTRSRSGHRSTRMRDGGTVLAPRRPIGPVWGHFPILASGQDGANRCGEMGHETVAPEHHRLDRLIERIDPGYLKGGTLPPTSLPVPRRASRPRRAPGATRARPRGGPARGRGSARGRGRRAQIGAQGRKGQAARSAAPP